MLCLWLTALALALFYYVCVRPLNKWKSRGIQQGDPKWFFGDFLDLVLQKKSFAEYIQWQYNRFKGLRYAGTYLMMQPALLIRDPDLLKQIAIKDFDHFTDHSPFVHEEADPLWSRNLFALRGEKWKDMRPVLSPAFTSSKMRTIFTLMSDCAEHFCQFLLDKNENVVQIEAKDLFTRFANDIIASTAYGIQVDSLNEPNNTFYKTGLKATDLSGWKNFRFLIGLIYPPISKVKFLSMKMFEDNVSSFFRDIIEQTLILREKQGITRNDMLQLLIEAQKGKTTVKESKESEVQDEFAATGNSNYHKTNGSTSNSIKLTDTDIVAQAMVFFFAGFDTVSTLITFMSYELAINEDIQDRLREEIEETLSKCGGKLNYDVLTSMKYLDMVVSESLRKWPSMVQMDRICTKPYVIEPVLPNEKPVKLEKDDIVHLPFFGLHRDPELYPEPEKFDPERFSDERKHQIKPGSYLPFGIGPRNCIGSRYALLEAKVLFFHLLKNFKIVPVAKTQIPVNLSAKSFSLTAEGGTHLGFKRLNKIE